MIFPLAWSFDPFPTRVKKHILLISRLFQQNIFYPIDHVIEQFSKYLPSSLYRECSSLFEFFMTTLAINVTEDNVQNLQQHYRFGYYVYLLKIMYSCSQKQNSQLKFFELFKELRGQSNSMMALDQKQNVGLHFNTRKTL
jgi:hypothetical protein